MNDSITTHKPTCNFPGCYRLAKQGNWACYGHWLKLPFQFKQRVLATYNQDETGYNQLMSEIAEWATKENIR